MANQRFSTDGRCELPIEPPETVDGSPTESARRGSVTRLVPAFVPPLLATGLALCLAVGLGTGPVAAQGSPGVPQDPEVVFTEDFESVATPDVAVLLSDYTGADGQTYTAHPDWINGEACNGLIASWNSTSGTTGCPPAEFDTYVRGIAQALGNEFGGGDDNQAMADNSRLGFPAPPTPAATLETVTPVPLPSSNRYIAFSIDVGVTACVDADPLLRFFLVDGASEIAVNDEAINPCTAPGGTTVPGGNGGIRIGSYATDGALFFTGTAVGVKLTNDQTEGNGNDYAVDNIRILDATPQLDKVFDPGVVDVGATTTLTFTITNTSELASKPGWSFTDVLPPGLTVADPANAETTCTNGTITAAAGGDTIEVSGDLETGQSSCTASVDVTSSTAGTYVNGPDNVEPLVGLNPPGPSEVTFVAGPGIDLEKSGEGPDPLVVGSTIDYSFVVTNIGNVILTNVAVTDPLPGLSPISCPDDTLDPGAEMTCTASYTVTQADVESGQIENTATASGQPPQGDPVTDTDTTTFPAVPPVPTLPSLAAILLLALLATSALWTLRRARA